MTEPQRRRLTFGIILTVIGVPLLAGSIASVARTPGSNTVVVIAGVLVLAVGLYLLARYFILRARK